MAWYGPITADLDLFDWNGPAMVEWSKATWERSAAGAGVPDFLRWCGPNATATDHAMRYGPGRDGVEFWRLLQERAITAASGFTKQAAPILFSYLGTPVMMWEGLDVWLPRRYQERLICRTDALKSGGVYHDFRWPAQVGHRARFIVTNTSYSGIGATPADQRRYQGRIFRFSEDGLWVEVAAPTADLVQTVDGLMQPGDVFGPWILEDIRYALRRMKHTAHAAHWTEWADLHLLRYKGKIDFRMLAIGRDPPNSFYGHISYGEFAHQFEEYKQVQRPRIGSEGAFLEYTHSIPISSARPAVLSTIPPAVPPNPLENNLSYMPEMMGKCISTYRNGWYDVSLEASAVFTATVWESNPLYPSHQSNYWRVYNDPKTITYQTYYALGGGYDGAGHWIGGPEGDYPLDPSSNPRVVRYLASGLQYRNDTPYQESWFSFDGARCEGMQLHPYYPANGHAPGVSRTFTIWTYVDQTTYKLRPYEVALGYTETLNLGESGLSLGNPTSVWSGSSDGTHNHFGAPWPNVNTPVPFLPAGTENQRRLRRPENPEGNNGIRTGWQAGKCSTGCTWHFSYT